MLTYLYDDIGRLLQVSGNDGSYVKTSYDKLDKSTDLHYKFNGQRRDVYFNYYNMDNLPLNVKFGTDSKYIVENNYDELTTDLLGKISNSIYYLLPFPYSMLNVIAIVLIIKCICDKKMELVID